MDHKEFTLLSNLLQGPNCTAIRVRVGRVWHLVNQGTNAVYAMNVQLLDKEGNQKMGMIRKHVLAQFEDILTEGVIYDIHLFNVEKADPFYRAIDEELMITFRTDTQVTELTAVTVDIPRYKFGFVDDSILHTRLNKTGQLTDVGGVLQSITNLIHITKRDGTQSVKRELRIQMFSGQISTISLWSDKMNLIDESTIDKYDIPVPIVITSTTVSIFGRSFTFNSTKATKLYLNIKIPQIEDFIQRSPTVASTKITVQNNKVNGQGSAAISTVNSTIASLMEELTNKTCRDKHYFVEATVTKVRNVTSWSYLSCIFCKGMVHIHGANYRCGKCLAENESPKHRYRLNFDIMDQSMTTTITAFDREAEVLVGKNVDEMLAIEKTENRSLNVEDIFNQIVGNEYSFEFRPTNYDMNTRDPMLTTKRINKQTYKPKTTTLSTQASQVTEYSVSFDSASGSSGKETSSAVDIKGKTVITSDGDKLPSCNKEKLTVPPAARTSGKRGIVINEVDEDNSASETAKLKVQEKRRKK